MKLFQIALLILSGSCGSSSEMLIIQRGGDQVGNGGKSVVCRDQTGSIESIEILDFYEGRELYGRVPRFQSPNPKEAIPAALLPLKELDPDRYGRYQNYLSDFFSNTKFISSPLMITNDSEEIIAPPEGCEIEQLIIQISPRFPQDRRYNINRELWEALDAQNRIGIILHEIIYYEALAQSHRNSVSPRYLTSLIASGELSTLTTEQYHHLMFQAQLQILNLEWDRHELHFVQTVDSTQMRATQTCTFFNFGNLGTTEMIEDSLTSPSAQHFINAMSSTDALTFWSRDRDPHSKNGWSVRLDLSTSTSTPVELESESSAQVLCFGVPKS
jgi:hypothetical protein